MVLNHERCCNQMFRFFYTYQCFTGNTRLNVKVQEILSSRLEELKNWTNAYFDLPCLVTQVLLISSFRRKRCIDFACMDAKATEGTTSTTTTVTPPPPSIKPTTITTQTTTTEETTPKPETQSSDTGPSNSWLKIGWSFPFPFPVPKIPSPFSRLPKFPFFG